MAAVLSLLIILTCIILILAVLVQNPKGGGLASGFSTGSQVIGVRRTADFLEKATWVLACCLLLFSITSTTIAGKGKSTAVTNQSSATKDQANKFNKPGAPAQNNGFMNNQAPPAGNPNMNPAPPAGTPVKPPVNGGKPVQPH